MSLSDWLDLWVRHWGCLLLIGSSETTSAESLPNYLNSFYARFEKDHLSQIISGKVPEKDTSQEICSHTLRHCAEQLGGVLQQLYKSHRHGNTPRIIPKKYSPKVINDLRPIVFTSFVMKTFKSILKSHITNGTDTHMFFSLDIALREGSTMPDFFLLDTFHKDLNGPKHIRSAPVR